MFLSGNYFIRVEAVCSHLEFWYINYITYCQKHFCIVLSYQRVDNTCLCATSIFIVNMFINLQMRITFKHLSSNEAWKCICNTNDDQFVQFSWWTISYRDYSVDSSVPYMDYITISYPSTLLGRVCRASAHCTLLLEILVPFPRKKMYIKSNKKYHDQPLL